ncbi:acidic phospholipase A2 PA-3-like [Physella acuta]|uniref:acidic phospholipase A2 PA-3-like n=1 Tax=Physella acuta TaxID=109671 RepID=UPI0027DC1B03|nr:acidic phospholipase A2 PA-3-like [Physella acuta]
MNSIPLFVILLLAAAYVVSPAEAVQKRATILLKGMIANVTESSTDYDGYGCFCYGGAGKKPVDELDSCCKAHNECYKPIYNKCFPTTIDYKYSCVGSTCTCDPKNTQCGTSACTCDLQLAKCVASKKYNDAYKNYDRKKLC